MKLKEAQSDDDSIRNYIQLLARCFPSAHHYTESYLRWLYRENPTGAVIGFDAWIDGELAAHYVCVPSQFLIEGSLVRGLLSLNTATHPSHQGKGLFTKLASATYDHAKSVGFDFVYGVANANSTPGFVRKLGFQLVRQLDARLGFGGLSIGDIESVVSDASFLRSWTSEQLEWRMRNPGNAVSVIRLGSRHIGATAETHKLGVRAWGEICVPHDIAVPASSSTSPPWPRLFLGILPRKRKAGRFYSDIPQKLRPSPLNLIYRDLGVGMGTLNPERIYFTFLDFDAY